MYIRSADRGRAALPMPALAALAAIFAVAVPDRAGAQNYPGTFDFGAPASAAEIATVAIAIAPDGKGLPPARATTRPARTCTRRPASRATATICRALPD
jgi:hypothetical protein